MYKTMKTTMGHKYRMRMAENEESERSLFRLAVVLLPFVTSVLFTALLLGR